MRFTFRLFLRLNSNGPLGHEHESSDGLDKDQAHDSKLFGEENLHQDEESEKDDRFSRHGSNGGGVEEEAEVLGMTLPTLKSGGKLEKGKKAATSDWDIRETEESPVLLGEAPASEDASPTLLHITQGRVGKRPRNGFGGLDAFYDVPDHMSKGANSVEGPCFTEPEEALHSVDPYIIAPDEQPLTEDAVPKDSVTEEEGTPEAVLEATQTEQIIQGSGDAETHPLNRCGKISNNLDDSYEPTPESNVPGVHDNPPQDFERLVSTPEPAVSAVRDDGFLPSPSAPSSIVPSIVEAAAPKAPEDHHHTIALKILSGTTVLRFVVFIRACTRTAILNEARIYCMQRAQEDDDHQNLGALLANNGWDLAFVSLRMYGCDEMDMSTYKVENLSSLIRTVEKTDIPRFTLRICEI